MPADIPISAPALPGSGRAPSTDERAKEASVLYPVLADIGMTTLLFVFAVITGSLTILSEAIRSILMLAASFYGLVVMRAMHRGRLSRFEFGVGKLEQFVAAVVGIGLAVSGLWVARCVVDTVFLAGDPVTPLGLASAAVVNAINTALNTMGWLAMKLASREGDSEVFRAQLRARTTMMTSSMFLQVTLTVAALAKDAGIALLLDAAGATFVAGLMIYNGLSMLAQALPDLLDAPAPAALGALIRRIAAQVVPGDQITQVRTRRSGPTIFAEVAVLGAPSVSALRERGAEIAQVLRDQGREVEVAVVLAPEPPPSTE
jgi:divalent metal cation (Fe/Co/Zn/Cd) transporter